MIRLTTSYETFLRNTTSQTLVTHQSLSLSSDRSLSMSMSPIPSKIIIPPMNANLNFSTVSPTGVEQMKAKAGEAPVILPPYFNWAEKSDQITPPPNQGKCGSCWAVAVASAISDNYVTRNLVPKNPSISPTYLLSCYPGSLKCGGGNPALSLQWIAKNGIAATADSFDYSWCSDNATCSGKTSSAVGTPIPVTYDTLNQLIPGCGGTAPLKFFISSLTMPQLTPDQANDPVKLATAITSVKTFLYTKGPAVTGFSVLENFTGGNYICKGNNPDNIYLENVDYNTGNYTTVKPKFLGGHAVVVVGWGSGKVRESLLKEGGNPQTMVDVPYWIARNSWDTKWGIGGFFRIAQYPFNKTSQFDATVFVQETIQDPTTGQTVLQNVPTGGILFFDTNYFGYGEPAIMESFYEATAEPSVVKKSTLPDIALYFVAGMLLFMLLVTVVVWVSTATHKDKKLKK